MAAGYRKLFGGYGLTAAVRSGKANLALGARWLWNLAAISSFLISIVKEFAQKRGLPLTFAASKTAPEKDQFDVSAELLRDSFDGWISGVGPSRHWRETRPLRTEDFMQVELVTVREGSRHRRWPPQVVMKFFLAEVIKPASRATAADRWYEELPDLKRVSPR